MVVSFSPVHYSPWSPVFGAPVEWLPPSLSPSSLVLRSLGLGLVVGVTIGSSVTSSELVQGSTPLQPRRSSSSPRLASPEAPPSLCSSPSRLSLDLEARIELSRAATGRRLPAHCHASLPCRHCCRWVCSGDPAPPPSPPTGAEWCIEHDGEETTVKSSPCLCVSAMWGR